MQCVKMQGSTKAVIVSDPSTSHLANDLQLNVSASRAQILLISGESSIKESRQEGRRNKSSWIQRLKPQDEPELSKGVLPEPSLETTNSEKWDSCERMDMSSGSVQRGRFPYDKSANGVRARPNWQAETHSDAKRQKMSEQKACNGVDKRRSDICQEKTIVIEPGKSMSSTAIASPSNVGFGPWVNLSSGRKPDMKPESVLGSKIIVGSATTSNDIQGHYRSAFSLTNSMPRWSPLSMADVTAPAIFYKPQLSPVHSKLGLPPRPPSQKTPGFHPPSKLSPAASGVGLGGFNQFSLDAQPNRQLFDTPSNREGNQFVGVQASELAEAAISRSESSFKKLKPSEQSFSDSIRDHGKGLSDCGQQLFASPHTRMDNNLPVRQARPIVAERASAFVAIGQPIGGCSDGAAVQFGNGRRWLHEDLRTNMSREGAREPTSTNLPSVGVDLHLKVSVPGMEDSKAASKNESHLQTASLETPFPQSRSGSSQGTSTSSKADAGVATSASLPWEMFIEPAGASRKAREQFVEVYNRARDELKNQRMSQTMSRVSAREMDGGKKLTLGPGDASSDHLERQLLKRDQHLTGHSQAQGRLNVLSTNPEHRTLSLESGPKEQHSISLVESKGPVTTLAYEQSDLHGVSLRLDTPDGFRREQTLAEGQPRSSVKTVDQQIACQSLDERPVAHSKELRPGDKGHMFSSTWGSNTKELASKLDEHDRKESTPALGKSSRVTFEEPSISRVSEKGAVSRARPQSSPHVWLQRWHPAMYNSKGLPDAQVLSDGKKGDSESYLALGLKKFKDGDGVGIFSRSKEFKNVSADKETGGKGLKTSPSKMLPSAAAMAIVGTAARQFCSAQPQRKGSFAFWSGYGMPPPRKVEPVQEKGKDKMFLKPGVNADVNMPNC